jgi:type I restriction enzyme S subunit
MAKWNRSPLGTVADLCLGKMLDQDKNRGDPLPYLANVNVRWGEFALDNLRTMRFEPHERDRYGLRFGDIVMCEGGEPGRCAIWRAQVPGMMIQKAIHRIRPRDALDYRFLYYDLLNIGNSNGFDQYFTGATIKHLPGEKLAKVEVSVPPLPVQRRIAGILSAYDDLIENSQRRIKILESMARALYREWFVHFRFPGHESVPRVPSPLGEIPQGWEVKPYTDAADVLSGGTPKTDVADYWDGDIPFFTPRDAPGCFYVNDCEKNITTIGLSKCASSLYPPDTVFITARGTVGKVALPSVPMAMNQSCYALQAKLGISQRYLFLLTLHQVDYLKTNTGGATFDTIVVDTFRRMQIVMPPRAVVADFAAQVNAMFDELNTLQRQTKNLRRTRDLLLPRLLSGQIDVEALDHA